MRLSLPKHVLALALAVAAFLSAGDARAQRAPAATPTPTPAPAKGTLNIVAIGASNTWGWGVGGDHAYPARLEALLRAEGYDARVTNAGVPFATTGGMLERIDSVVPDGTHVVILQPGGNDRRFLRSAESRAANIAAMVKRLEERKIKPIVFDPAFAWQHYQWDFIHFNVEGHAWIAATLLPQVIAAAATVRVPAKPQR
jgi:acyl-CoA thioesterase-1